MFYDKRMEVTRKVKSMCLDNHIGRYLMLYITDLIPQYLLDSHECDPKQIVGYPIHKQAGFFFPHFHIK